jgi:hypothetical protein
MASITIYLHRDDERSVLLIPCAEDRAFLSLRLGGVSLLLPGYDEESAQAATDLAQQLLQAAADLRSRHPASAPSEVSDASA